MRSLCESRIALRKKIIRGASPGVSYELLDKNGIGGRRCDFASHERKVGDMEFEIVTAGRSPEV